VDAAVGTLPPGFVVDTPPAGALPPGFVLDAPAPHRSRTGGLPPAALDTDDNISDLARADDAQRNAPGFEDMAPDADAKGPSNSPLTGTTYARALINSGNQAMIGAVGSGIRGASNAYQRAGVEGAEADIAARTNPDSIVSPETNPRALTAQMGRAAYLRSQSPADNAAAVTADKAMIAAGAGPAPGAQTGQDIIDYAQKNYPVDPRAVGFGTKITGALGGFIPIAAAGAAGTAVAGPLGGAAAMTAVAAPQTYDGHYQAAIAKGATPDQANDAATKAVELTTPLMFAPYGALFNKIPGLRDGLASTLVNLGRQGLTFGSASAAQQFANNYVAKNTYDPDRNYTDGVADAAMEGTILGIAVPTAMGVAKGIGAAIRNRMPPAPSAGYQAAVGTLKRIAGAPPDASAPPPPPPDASAPTAPPPEPSPRPPTPAPQDMATPKPEQPTTSPNQPISAQPEQRPAQPTPAQAAAGNDRKVQTKVGGLNIAIETAAGQIRQGVGADGQPWSVQMPADYGYVKGTEGADSDPVDVFLRPGAKAAAPMKPVFVIDQKDPETGQFDEHKAMIGYDTPQQAIADYLASFSDGSGTKRYDNVTSMTFPEFKEWVKNGDTTSPIAGQIGAPASSAPVPSTPPSASAPVPSTPPSASAPEPQGATAQIAQPNQSPTAGPSAPTALDNALDAQGHFIDVKDLYLEGKATKEDVSAAKEKAEDAFSKLSANSSSAPASNAPTPQSPSASQTTPQNSTPPTQDASGRTMVGTNRDGRPVWQDPNGVRSIMDAGIRQTEPVQMVPTPQGLHPVVDTRHRPPDFKTTEELAQEGVPHDVRQPDSEPVAPTGPKSVQLPGTVGTASDVDAGQGQGGGGAGGGDNGTAPAPPARKPRAKRATVSAGDGAGGSDGLPGGPAPGTAQRPADTEAPAVGSNLVLAPGEIEENRSLGQKARDNLAAIELSKQIVADGRLPTRDEQVALAKYVGWGGLSKVFEAPDPALANSGLAQIGARLREVLTKQEYEQARSSTQYAHYTAEVVVRGMWDTVAAMGFTGGMVFEPGMGVGGFVGMMPSDLAPKVAYQGIELDPITASIAKLIYPQAGIRNSDLFKTPIPEEAFDVAIGNPPFAAWTVKQDPKYAARGFLLHDYFFAKSIDSVRPGGLLAFVTSAGSMNKLDPDARRYMAERAEFLGGVRLPSNAFKQNAGTEVTTDILFFRRRPEGRVPLNQAGDITWTEVVPRTLPSAQGGTRQGNVSRYFSDHPEQVLGREGFFDKLYQDRYAVHAPPGQDFAAELRAALGRLPKDVMTAPLSPEQRAAIDFDSAQKKDGSFYVDPKQGLMQYRQGAGRPVQRRGKGVEGGFTAPELERITALIPVRDALRDVFRADLAGDDKAATEARKRLNKTYDGFVAKFGPINKSIVTTRRPSSVQEETARREAREEARELGQPWDDGTFDPDPFYEKGAKAHEIAKARQATRDAFKAAGKPYDEGTFDASDLPDIKIEKLPNIDPFLSDPESYRLRSIEDYSDATGAGTKKDIFTRSVITREKPPQINSVNDGILWSLNKFGRLDIDAIAGQMGKTPQAIIAALGDRVFRVPGSDTYQVADEYLSGDVKTKLAEARQAADRDPSFERNVAALEGAQPTPIAPTEINMAPGMPWMPTHYIEQFAKEELKFGRTHVVHIPVLGMWKAEDAARGYISVTDDQSGLEKYRVAENDNLYLDAHGVLEAAMNRTWPKCYDTVLVFGKEKRVLNPAMTERAQDMVAEVKQRFTDWVERDPARHEALTDLYNEKMNRVVHRTYDGSYLTTPGISGHWRWRPHQTRVVSRIILTGNTYMAHAVGAGKTSAMIGSAMEMRRLGLVRKPMFVVPNHMLGQFTKEFYEQYPTARIMVADEERFHTHNRRQFVANVAQDDLDAVIITHSGFGHIPISDEFSRSLVQEQIDQLTDALASLDKKGGDRITVKKIEAMKKKLEQKLLKATDHKDQTLTFEEMGVDFLFVDEAHLFRKLSFSTVLGQLKGITAEGSEQSWDLYTKVRYLESKNPGRSLVMASGTPITNTMGELYSITRYIDPGALAARGISHFDSWAQAFGDTGSEMEPQPDGSYKQVTRFNRFVNVPELYKMVGATMDIVTPHELSKYVVRPALKGGSRSLQKAPLTKELAKYRDELGARMKAISERTGPPKKGDDILLSVINDGRHAAIDPRFVMAVGGVPPSKLNAALDNVFRIWRDGKNTQFYSPASAYKEKSFRGPSTQMIFCNMGVNGRGPNGFSAYAWIRRSLEARGVPSSDIAFIGDYSNPLQRQGLFNDMNDGKVRILVGSVQKMGTGVNAQRRLAALHNLDPLWFPADDEQRVGRILRQGNHNPEIEVHDYTTEDTYDATMWGMMGRKGRFIEQFFRGDPELRDMEDLGEASMYEQAAAMTMTDPRAMHLTQFKQDLQKAERRLSAHERSQAEAKNRMRSFLDAARRNEAKIPLIEADIAQRQDTRGDAFRMTVARQDFDNRKDAAEALAALINDRSAGWPVAQDVEVGSIGSFSLVAQKRMVTTKAGTKQPTFDYALKLNGGREIEVRSDSGSATGLIQSAETALRRFETDLKNAQQAAEAYHKQAADIAPLLGQPFKGSEQIAELRAKVRALTAELSGEVTHAPMTAGNGDEVPRVQGAHDAVADVLDFGRRTGNEKLILLDPDAGTIGLKSEGIEDSCGFTPEMLAAMADPASRFVAIHNHPGNRALSLSDLTVLFDFPAIAAVIAAAHDGNVSSAALTGARTGKARDTFANAYDKAAERVANAFVNAALASKIDLGVYEAFYHDGMNRILDAMGLIHYTSSFAQPPAFHAALEKIAADLAPGEPNGRNARLAAVVRPDTAVDRCVAEAQGEAGQRSGDAGGAAPRAQGDSAPQGKPPAGGHLAEVTPSLRDQLLYSTASRAPPAFDPDPKFVAGLREMPAPFGEPLRAVFRDMKDRALNGLRDQVEFFYPMRGGTPHAQKVAFDLANRERRIAYECSKLDTMLAAKFTPSRRAAMGRALDAQSVFERMLEDNLAQLPEEDRAAHAIDARAQFDDERTGLAGLPTHERDVVEMINGLLAENWAQMQASGVVKPNARGIKYYMPRQAVNVLGGNVSRVVGRPGSGGARKASPSVRGLHPIGTRVTTSAVKHRKYLTPEESEAAMKARFGDNAELVTDIRATVIALAKGQRAIAGKDMISAIKAYGVTAHESLVMVGGGLEQNPQHFTIADHPAFWEWRPRIGPTSDGGPALEPEDEQTYGVMKDEHGNPIFDRVPIYISNDFKGPLSAVLTAPSPPPVRVYMRLKGLVMRSVLWSPFMHLDTEIGRALPTFPGKILTGRIFVDGHRMLANDDAMNEAISGGLTPAVQRWSQDNVTIMDQAINPYGRTPIVRHINEARDKVAHGIERWISKLSKAKGEFAGTVIRDYEQALLWRNVLKLQCGIYKNALDKFLSKNLPRRAAVIMASHVANRYAGSLPTENMARWLNILTNIVAFSRSFTGGNLGVMKDAVKGPPKHILNAITEATYPFAVVHRAAARVEAARRKCERTEAALPGSEAAERARRKLEDAEQRLATIVERHEQQTAALRKSAKSAIRGQAAKAVALDIGLAVVGRSILGVAFRVALLAHHFGFVGAAAEAYNEWVHDTQAALHDTVRDKNPLELGGIFPQNHNEPGEHSKVFIGTDQDGRGIYLRPMVGKVGDLMLDVMTSPNQFLASRENPMLSGLLELLPNVHDRFGRALTNQDPKTIGDDLRNIGIAIEHVTGSLLPLDSLHTAGELFSGDHKMAALGKLAFEATGAGTLSRGFPGGPQAGVEYAAKKRDQYIYEQIALDVREKMAAGDMSGAVDDIQESGMSDYGKQQAIHDLRYASRPVRQKRSTDEDWNSVNVAPSLVGGAPK
jgi:N12 class adenine-specific DNA methylase